MSSAEQLAVFAGEAADALESAWTLLPRAVVALIVGGLISWRPWRRGFGQAAPRREMAQAQMLLCVAGCLMVAVIGDNVARAFGLVGIGGLIRFRAALKDPRDGAIFFLLIGLGMAAGMGAYALVGGGALFVVLLLACVDRFWPSAEKAPQMRVLMRCDHPRQVESQLRPALAAAQIAIKESEADDLGRLLKFVVLEPSPGAVAGVLLASGLPIEHVRCEPARDNAAD